MRSAPNRIKQKVIRESKNRPLLWHNLNGQTQMTIVQFEDAGVFWPDS